MNKIIISILRTLFVTAAVCCTVVIMSPIIRADQNTDFSQFNVSSGIYLTCSIEQTGMDAWWPEDGNNLILRDENWIWFRTRDMKDLMPGDVIIWMDDEAGNWVNHIAVLVEVDQQGEWYTTADGNQYTETGINFVTRYNLSKSGSTYGEVTVWRNERSGQRIADHAREFTQGVLDRHDTSYIDAWSSFGWCYCYACTLLLTVEEYPDDHMDDQNKPDSQDSGIDSGSEEESDKDAFRFTLDVTDTDDDFTGRLYAVVSAINESEYIIKYMITDGSGHGYAAWKSTLPEGKCSVRSGRYYYNTSWLIDYVECGSDANVVRIPSVTDSYLSKK